MALSMFEAVKGSILRAARGAATASLVCVLAHPLAGLSSDLLLLTEDNPPLCSVVEGKPAGIACDIVSALETRVGERAPIRILPWARAYKLALERNDVALFATVRTPEREALFEWVGPLTSSVTSFYAKRDSTLRISGIEDARHAESILVPREFSSHQYLRAQGFTNLDAVNTPEMMVRMLLAGRAPLMVANNLTLPTLLAKAGGHPSDVVPVYSFIDTDSYIAFSRSTPPDRLRAWQNALDQMRRDGTIERIDEKWLPGDRSTQSP